MKSNMSMFLLCQMLQGPFFLLYNDVKYLGVENVTNLVNKDS